MTFEEFLIKKKIDLALFKTAEPGLCTEFQSHYGQMGPKSFDHTKKFLFNKLRRAYHLKEEPKPVSVKEVIEINEIAAQAEPLLSPTVEATVYTPRIKENQVSSVKNQDSGEVKPAYVPRFKSPAAKPDTEASDLVSQTSDLRPQTYDPKPAFKPRFKPGLTGSTEAKPAEEAKEETADKPKPAYVPRFKAPVTKAPETSDLRPQTSDNSPAEEPKEEIADKPKPAYVPRFKPPKPQ